ncbi:hypothetical protein [Bradyrhizobium sp. JYMT SZCCT0428]|uniref:hypothetical protein n=1 Tax=Bradyrhizobium sp. JYMT SZCCT0428 TaxID=2807673 RepID=UPI001BAC7941|nr:hypothetical protein [Bradyrhizobium sp. JYMT SZCCT0428]MBR1153737.1 hypothetical protein [Bradyrhizobium sp. JYMT SZCCT0428]
MSDTEGHKVIDMKTRKPLDDDFLQKGKLVAAVRVAKKFRDLYDPIGPALYIDRLIREDLPKSGKTAENVKRALQAAGRGNLTHWERLRLKHENRGREQAKAELLRRQGSDAVSKKVQKYVWLLEALADVLERPHDEVLFAAFKDCQIEEPTVANDLASELASWINLVADSVVKSEDLKAFFREVGTVRGTYDEVSGNFAGAMRLLMEGAGSSGVLLGEAELAWIQFPLPRIPLFRSRRHSFDGPLYVSRKPIADVNSTINEVIKLISPTREEQWALPEQPLENFHRVNARVDVFSDLRLVIGPSKSKQDIEAMFETGAWVELEILKRDRPTTFPYSIVPMAGFTFDEEANPLVRSSYRPTVGVRLDDGWHSLAGLGNKQGWQALHNASEEFGRSLDMGPQLETLGHQSHEFAVYWWPVNASTLEKVMQDFLSANSHHSYGKNLVPKTGPHSNPKELPLGFWPELEIALFNDWIRESLSSSCRRLKEKFQLRLIEAKQIREREKQFFLNQLQMRSDQVSKFGNGSPDESTI